MGIRQDKKEKLMDLLRRSVPDAGRTDDIEERILHLIREKEDKKFRSKKLQVVLFSWTEITWIRRSFAAASFILVIMFTWQQSLIVKRLGSLERMNTVNWEMYPTGTPQVNQMQGVNSNKGMYLFLGKEIISDERLENIYDSYGEIEEKYLKLFELIDKDPELREYIENRLKERTGQKMNL